MMTKTMRTCGRRINVPLPLESMTGVWQHYPGEVIRIVAGECEGSVMVKAGAYLKWPAKRDAIFYKQQQILCAMGF